MAVLFLPVRPQVAPEPRAAAEHEVRGVDSGVGVGPPVLPSAESWAVVHVRMLCMARAICRLRPSLRANEEDLVQDTLLQILPKTRRMPVDVAGQNAWLFRALELGARATLRRQRRRRDAERDCSRRFDTACADVLDDSTPSRALVAT